MARNSSFCWALKQAASVSTWWAQIASFFRSGLDPAAISKRSLEYGGWRRKDCFVYRFISTGSMRKKIFQRQSHKQSLSSCVVDSAEMLSDISPLTHAENFFNSSPDASDTHDTFKCKRCRPDGTQFIKALAMLYGDTSTLEPSCERWQNGALGKIQDCCWDRNHWRDVSAIFQYISHDMPFFWDSRSVMERRWCMANDLWWTFWAFWSKLEYCNWLENSRVRKKNNNNLFPCFSIRCSQSHPVHM